MAPFVVGSLRQRVAPRTERPETPGRRSKRPARQVAECLGAAPSEVVFTSGGTEADNLAVFGTLAASGGAGRTLGAVCSAVEHAAVLEPLRAAATGRGRCSWGRSGSRREVGVRRARAAIDLDQLRHERSMRTPCSSR